MTTKPHVSRNRRLHIAYLHYTVGYSRSELAQRYGLCESNIQVILDQLAPKCRCKKQEGEDDE